MVDNPNRGHPPRPRRGIDPGHEGIVVRLGPVNSAEPSLLTWMRTTDLDDSVIPADGRIARLARIGEELARTRNDLREEFRAVKPPTLKPAKGCI